MSSDDTGEMTDFRGLLEALCREGVEFILVGGVAARIHGFGEVHGGLELVYGRGPSGTRTAREGADASS